MPVINIPLPTSPRIRCIVRHSGIYLNDLIKGHKNIIKTLHEPMVAVREHLYGTVFRDNFDSESGPHKWRGISDNTWKWRTRVGIDSDAPPLQPTLGLRAAATMSTKTTTRRGKPTPLQIKDQPWATGKGVSPTSRTILSSIGRVVKGGKVVKRGKNIHSMNEIVSTIGKARLSLSMVGEDKETTDALFALQLGSRDGRIPERNFWFISRSDMNDIRGIIRTWGNEKYKMLMAQSKKRGQSSRKAVAAEVTPEERAIGRRIISEMFGR